MNLNKTVLLIASLTFLACGGGSDKVDEDKEAKSLLAGTWTKDDDGTTAFTAEGDTIYFNDPLVLPVYFYIHSDSLVLESSKRMSYKITKQSANVFSILNQNNEVLRYVKQSATDDLDLAYDSPVPSKTNTEEPVPSAEETVQETGFNNSREVCDTIAESGAKRYRCLVNVKKSRNQVVKTSFNEDGIGVDKIYYDNIVELKVYCNSTLLLTKNFRKSDFAKFIPADQLKQCVLSDIEYFSCDDHSITCHAIVSPADSPVGYIVNITISARGGYRLSAEQ